MFCIILWDDGVSKGCIQVFNTKWNGDKVQYFQINGIKLLHPIPDTTLNQVFFFLNLIMFWKTFFPPCYCVKSYQFIYTIIQQLINSFSHWIDVDAVILWTCCRATLDCVLPEWICNLTDTGEWLHTGSRRSTQATEQTETLYMNGNSGKAKQNKFSSLEKISRYIMFILSSIIFSPHNCPRNEQVYGNTSAVFFFVLFCFEEVRFSWHVTRQADSDRVDRSNGLHQFQPPDNYYISTWIIMNYEWWWCPTKNKK